MEIRRRVGFFRVMVVVCVLASMVLGSLGAMSVSASVLALAPGPDLSVDAAAAQHPISPYIYGMNFADEDLADALNLPLRRWGGNSTTRYNWQLDVRNTGSDWYYENISYSNDHVELLPDGSATDLFVEQDRRTGSATILNASMIGWTPNRRTSGHPYDCGFKVSRYGAQDSVDTWDTDCGNGVQSGTDITGNDPLDTSVAVTTTFVTSWIQHLTAKYGTAGNGGVKFYNLDNEPMLWNSTHRDVHPTAPSYDEIRDRTWDYAAAIKAADPSAQTLGPVVWGWMAYFWSALDGESGGNWWNNPLDRLAHGDVPFIPWYLQQMQAYDTAHGTRILDYLDMHYYPQANGVALSNSVDAATQVLRLRSTRSLWDPTYTDESWIGEPVYLIPRMKQWVDDNYPGTKLAVTEYNWGAPEHINGALAQADVLGIFGREGLDLATLWGPPDLNNPVAFAFRMFLNYDGAGATFGDTSIQASSADQEQLAVYAAQRSSDGMLTLMIINKTGSELTSALSLANFQPGASAQVYRYSAANLAAIVHEPDQPLSAGGFSATYPANSITLLAIAPAGGPLTDVSIGGETSGATAVDQSFTAAVTPADASVPITYTWSPQPSAGQGAATVTYNWATTGSKTISVTAENDGGSAVDTHTILISDASFVPLSAVQISGPEFGVISETLTFAALVSPLNASLPITYSWSPEPVAGQGTATTQYSWPLSGTQTITLTAHNGGDVFSSTHTLKISDVAWPTVYLPVILR